MNMMADRYASDLALVVVAQITQTIGYSCSLSAPLELLQDILQKFVQEFARDMHGHMEHANRIEPNLKDARLSIQNLSINVQELLDYIGNVEPVGFIRDVPQFPIGKTLNMNFLKPGSAETLTRPVYIFEYLPPMQDPELREMPADAQKEFSEKQEFCSKAEYNSTNAADKFGAKHIDSISPNAVINFRSSAFDLDVGRSVREMSSVVMTTGGFISPAIEGKLPEDIIPDIVEKFLGLDAPFSPTIIVNSLKKSPQLAFSDRDTTVNPRKAITSETKIFKQNAALLTSGHSESSIMYASNNHPMLTARTPKKNKKQKHDLICEPGQSELLTNPFEKAQEKSQRKALKMYKQTSKNQSDTSSNQIQNMRKLKKRFNRGSFDPNKKHLQKIFKKQSKLKQNDLQLDIDEKHFLQNSQTTSGLAIKANSDTENDLQADIPSQPPTVTSQVKNNFRNSIYPVQPSVIQQTQVLLSEKKSGSEPERSKLDVFKKISKPRTPRPDIGATSIPPGTGVSVFGSTMSTPALISLPSGTTITPTPSLGLNSENKNVSKINPCSIFDGTIPLTKEGVEMSIIDSSKPKKRGRKPGGKNVIKQTNFVSQSLINAVERKKSSQAITLPLSPSPIIISQSSLNVSPPTEPLNLCNAEQPSNNFLSNLYAKEKKDRKKYKSLPENVMEFDKSCSPEKASTLNNSNRATKLNNDVQCSDKFVTVSKALSNASIYPGIQTGMVPLLPLLQFPPRPGLIPTGPGLFPAVTGLVGFGNHGNRVPISPFIDYPGTEESVADTVRCLPIKESPVTDSDQFLSRSSTQTGLQMDRNYCNVAPLVPDSMKFTECKSVSCASTILENPSAQATSKINTKLAKEASGNPDDPIEVSDDSDESLHNRMMVQRKTPISSPTYVKTSFAELHSSSLTSATSIDEEKSKMDLRNIVSLSSNEPLKKFKNLVKQSIPDVKSVTHTPPPHSSFPQFNLPNFMGGDKFSLAGGADLIPLSRMSDSEYSSKIVPFSSLGGTIPNQIKVSEDHHILSTFSNYEDITITPTGLTSLEPKMRKHHKKLKKVKEGKNKKKKEKKEKSKKTDQIGLTFFKSDRKIKAYDKKQKKEKKKDKDKQILVHIPDDTKEFTKVPLANNDEPVLKSSSMTISPSLGAATSEMSPNQIPKLTLKLSGKSTLFSSSEKEMTDAGKLKQTTILSSENKKRERDNSPELARFSPLVTGPPKNKQSETLHLGNSSTAVLPVPSPVAVRTVQLPVSQTSSNSAGWLSNPSHSNAASSTLSASSVLLPQQLMLAPNTIMNNFVPANCNSTGTLSKSGLCSSPLNTSEENANAMQIAESSRPSSYVDAEGNRIWICPACGKVDDGSAMIGCDGCDAWYHWICVGITFAPKDNDDWFCRICVTKKRFHGSEKKKRRNKKK